MPLALAGLIITMLATCSPAAADEAVFSDNSDYIYNRWLGLIISWSWIGTAVGTTDDYRLLGGGPFEGSERTYSLIRESDDRAVLGVACRTYRIEGYGPGSPERYDIAVAQDVDGNVRYLAVAGIDGQGQLYSWQAAGAAEAPILLPAAPEVGQQFTRPNGWTAEVVATDVTLARLPTEMGPYYHCLQLRLTRGPETHDQWLCPFLGVVKEVWPAVTGAVWHRAFDAEDVFPISSVISEIARTLGKPVADITREDLKQVSALDYGSFPATLEGVQHCDNLVELSYRTIGGSSLDIDQIGDLTKLESLSLEQGHITDFSPLANLTNLRTLRLRWTACDDIRILAGLINLQVLDLTGNEIMDASPLSRLAGLTELDLTGNEIADISPLSGLTGLTELHLWGNPIEDLSALAGLSQLEVLYLGSGSIRDLSPLQNLTQLLVLGLGNTRVADISPLAALGNLQRVTLYENLVTDISSLMGLENLLYVDLRFNPLAVAMVYDYIPLLRDRGVEVRHNTIVPILVYAVADPPFVYHNRMSDWETLPLRSTISITFEDHNGNSQHWINVGPDTAGGAMVWLYPTDDEMVWEVMGRFGPDVPVGTAVLRIGVQGLYAGGYGETLLEVQVRPLGDVDGNGGVEPADLQPLLQALNGNPPAGYHPKAFDLDGNGACEPGDLMLLLSILNGRPLP